MSTRARIGLLTPAGVESIHIQHDGYYSHLGAMLLEHVRSEADLQAVIDRGDASGMTVDGRFDHYAEPWPTHPHRKPERLERVAKILHPIDAWPDSWQNYEYLWRDGAWWGRRVSDRDFRPLADCLADKE